MRLVVVEAMLSIPSPICNSADSDQLVAENPRFPAGSDQLLQVLPYLATAFADIQAGSGTVPRVAAGGCWLPGAMKGQR